MRDPSFRRSLALFRAFLREQDDPHAAYELLARDAADQVERLVPLEGRVVVDVGGGRGYFTREFRRRGAHGYLFEPDPAELAPTGSGATGTRTGDTAAGSGGTGPRTGDTATGSGGTAACSGSTAAGSGGTVVVADGYLLPLADGVADVCFSSNVLEHVRDPGTFLSELVRVTRPGGLIYVSFTNWLSPWGGHEWAPWHYLGAERARARYERRTGRAAKHRLGENLFAIGVGSTLRQVRGRDDVEILSARSRYWPVLPGVVTRVPVVREFATWNLLLLLRRCS
ncbi:class I SAM-dependent methyltransferase [Streptomyces sp. NRRL F-5727]|uniref:class I SAM-dependent methyltransferase n=1 Tax=Streptomyces sp. NRRL F-5727 TaxID=1463871 RepID=UPI0004C6B988|nr:class I SAM-dependent methyltransferase [Streptomyces sp. NRRL F-5727]